LLCFSYRCIASSLLSEAFGIYCACLMSCGTAVTASQLLLLRGPFDEYRKLRDPQSRASALRSFLGLMFFNSITRQLRCLAWCNTQLLPIHDLPHRQQLKSLAAGSIALVRGTTFEACGMRGGVYDLAEASLHGLAACTGDTCMRRSGVCGSTGRTTTGDPSVSGSTTPDRGSGGACCCAGTAVDQGGPLLHADAVIRYAMLEV